MALFTLLGRKLRLGGACCHHLTSAMKKAETTRSFNTAVYYMNGTWRHIPEDTSLHSHCCTRQSHTPTVTSLKAHSGLETVQ
jgi:hypothetical protein